MPSCQTKLFARFHSRPASPRQPLQPRLQTLPQTRARNDATPGKWLVKPRSDQRRWPGTLPSNASRQAVRGLTNAAAILRRIRRRAHPARKHWLHAARAAICFLFLASASTPAADGDGPQLFQSGRVAFEAGNYAAALESFEAALDAKFERPALHFNIGVTAYRLGRYERAETAFLEVARTPAMAALTHYNLGLVALARDDTAAAKRWFALCDSETQDDRLRALASTQLARLPSMSARDWNGYATLSAGYDDNVALVSNSDVLGVSGSDDAFVDGQFVAAIPIDESWRVDAGALLLGYRELDEFNQITAYGGGRYLLSAGDWTGDVGVQLTYGTLGGESFQNTQTAQLQGGTDLSADWRMRLRYRLTNVDGMHDFTGISGTRQEASLRFGWEANAWRVDAEYQLEDSNLQDESLSLTRHQVAIGIEHTPNAAWTFACQLARSHSRFDEAASGNEDRTDLEASVARTFASNWQIVLRYAYADNAADRSDFDYRRNRISLGVEMNL